VSKKQDTWEGKQFHLENYLTNEWLQKEGKKKRKRKVSLNFLLVPGPP